MLNNKNLNQKLQKIIEDAWDANLNISKNQQEDINHVLELLDSGSLRVAEKINNNWIVHQWIKKAILLSFKINNSNIIEGTPCGAKWYDKINSKLHNWNEENYIKAGFRAVPGCFIRKSAYIGQNVVVMPSFINVGAYIDNSTMIDSFVTIGSCAQIGKNCHISEGVGIGGVLEPLQNNPVIIEDNCFIGMGSKIADGIIVEEGSVIATGVFLSASTKIVDRESGEIYYGRIPKNSVVISGYISNSDKYQTANYCALIVKKVDQNTLNKTAINQILREI